MVNLQSEYFFWKLEKMISTYTQCWFDIIENMKNDNTYKLAWARSILETVGRKSIYGDLIINFDELSVLIIKYYWNQLYFFNLTQGRNKQKKPVIEQIVNEMIGDYQNYSGSNIPVWFEKCEPYFKADDKKYKRIINRVSNALSKDVCYRFKRIQDKDLPIYDLDIKKRIIVLKYQDAKVLQEDRFILAQLVNYKWAQLLEQFNMAPRIANKVKGLSDSKIRRNNLTKYKEILLASCNGNPKDFYTGLPLSNDDISVDHVIPWSYMYSDDIWNLVLTSKSNNSKKSNNIPSDEEIKRLNRRNEYLRQLIASQKYKNELEEAISNHYVDKFYNALRL